MGSKPSNNWSDGVSLVIPAYNEEARVKSALTAYIPVLKGTGLPFEIIVVADGDDHTFDVVSSIGEQSIRVLQFGNRLGKGGAIIEGFRASKFRRVGYVDADGSLAPESLSDLISHAGLFDCVFGSRRVNGSVWLSREPRAKMLAGRIFNALVRAVLGVELHDTQCGAKFYSAPFLQRLLPQVYVNNLTTDVSFVLHSKLLGATYVELPVTWTNRDNSRYSLLPMAFSMFATVIGMRVANSRLLSVVPPQVVTTVHRIVDWVQ